MGSLADFLSAIKGQESGGNYRAVNGSTGALGLYQVLPSNVTPWAKKYLGIYVTPTQFLNSASLQEKLVGSVMRDYVNRYGYRGAASAWYSGNPSLANNYRPQNGGPSIGDYVDQVMQRMGEGGFSMATLGIGDAVKQVAQSTVRATPGFKQDPLELNQAATPNPIAADRNEPAAVKGLGLSIEDGSGAGQTGIAAPLGVDSTSAPPGQNDSLLAAPVGWNGPTKAASDMVPFTGTGGHDGGGGIFDPLPGYHITFGFGQKYSSSGHAAGPTHLGVDFAAPIGTRILSPVSGRIVSAGWENSGFGNAIRIQNSDGTFTILGHLSSLGDIRPGMVIKPGMYLGNVGATGDASGAHLHMEMRRSLYDPRTAFDFTDQIEW